MADSVTIKGADNPPVKAEPATCGNCPYWAGADDPPVAADPVQWRRMQMRDAENIGAQKTVQRECRKSAPLGVLIASQGVGGMQPAVFTLHPATTAEHWCGDHPHRKLIPLSLEDFRQIGVAVQQGQNAVLKMDYERGKLNRDPTVKEMEDMIRRAGGEHSAFSLNTGVRMTGGIELAGADGVRITGGKSGE